MKVCCGVYKFGHISNISAKKVESVTKKIRLPIRHWKSPSNSIQMINSGLGFRRFMVWVYAF